MKHSRQFLNAMNVPIRISVPSGSITLPVYESMGFVEDTKNGLVVLDVGLRVPVVNVEWKCNPNPEEKTVFIVSEDVFKATGRRRDVTTVKDGMFLRRDSWVTGPRAMIR